MNAHTVERENALLLPLEENIFMFKFLKPLQLSEVKQLALTTMPGTESDRSWISTVS